MIKNYDIQEEEDWLGLFVEHGIETPGEPLPEKLQPPQKAPKKPPTPSKIVKKALEDAVDTITGIKHAVDQLPMKLRNVTDDGALPMMINRQFCTFDTVKLFTSIHVRD